MSASSLSKPEREVEELRRMVKEDEGRGFVLGGGEEETESVLDILGGAEMGKEGAMRRVGGEVEVTAGEAGGQTTHWAYEFGYSLSSNAVASVAKVDSIPPLAVGFGFWI
eukprot:1419138-Rhodomonas_salina.1